MKLYYCIQCLDKKTGDIGDFVHSGDFESISPVFKSLTELFAWTKENGLKTSGHAFELEV